MGFFDKGGHPVDDTKMSHPWGKASFAHCHQPFSWRQMNKNMSKDVFKTGGLGTLMEMDGYETWVCLHSSITRPHWNPQCPHTGPVATVDPWFCWVYHETREEFTPWGPNSRVKLFDPPPVKYPIDKYLSLKLASHGGKTLVPSFQGSHLYPSGNQYHLWFLEPGSSTIGFKLRIRGLPSSCSLVWEDLNAGMEVDCGRMARNTAIWLGNHGPNDERLSPYETRFRLNIGRGTI